MTTEASRAGNLPASFASFVGRRSDVAGVCGLLRTARLVTLTGSGGIGKTRLALEVAADSAKTFPDGAWLVDLAPVREPSVVAGVAASALGVPDLGPRPGLEQLAGFLAERRALMVLDNCEHLAGACAELAKTLLSAAPELHILATSRHTLGITGEHVFAVSPLPPEDAADLLRDRAAAVRSGFQVGDANRAEVTRLCAELDGLPLAIELAASRLRSLTVKQVVDRLEDLFGLLTSGSPTALPHQRTLHGAIGWSYELCEPAERLLWNRLSVFAGGFALDAVEGVCAGDGIEEDQVLDLLDRLVVQSVVLTTETEGALRYRLLETIRQYGRERLAASGEEERLLDRHRAFFLTLARGIAEGWYGPTQVEDLTRLRVEHTNLLAALDRDTDSQARLELVDALQLHWCVGGFLTEGRRQLDRALAGAPEPTVVRARALVTAVWVAQSQGDLVAADRWLDEAEGLGEQVGDPVVLAFMRGFRGLSAEFRGRSQDAVTRYKEAWTDLAALGEAEATSWLLVLACSQAYAGDPGAVKTCRQVIEAFEASGERWGRALVLTALGHNAWERGDRESAKALARYALQCMSGFNDYTMVARTLELLAWATASGGGHEWSARLLGAADALWKYVGTAISAFGPHMAGHHARCEKAVVDALGLGAYAQALAEGGRHDSPGRAIRYALDPVHESTASIAAGPLSPREREVAALVAKGLTNRQIASTLKVSRRTADRHVQNILGKLGFGSRAQIASWWSTTQVPTVP
ncbi:ATP-binding protein [Streptomyces sp. NPDC002623]